MNANTEDTGTIAFVSGANKGIGYEIARGLGAQPGTTVLIGARDEQRGRAAADTLAAEGVTARWVRLDVTDSGSAEAAAKWIDEEYGRLDILVNNAGIAISRDAPSATSPEVMRRTYETNVFGVVSLTNAMLPLLRRAPAARVVNISSGLGSVALASDPQGPWWETNLLSYNSSKAALNMITVSYAKELRETAIKVNAADPGYCGTDLNQHQGVRTPAQGAAIALRLATLPGDGPTGGLFNDDGPVPW
jgi:NAD(P)-dependent dehydrogenase (short-subunit alcohol dehydrogenase family)